ncbi:MAG: CDP-glycerol glycerophosphotransferase family protein [Lachnospiraceae bacterium]|nr:CDP-glycerol glycerophosphotransferase family protein [Lachnospiraceae bacterium]
MRSLIIKTVIQVVKIVMNLIYIPLKMRIKTEDKIVYLSRQSNEKSLDMLMLEEEIARKYPQYKQVFRLKMIDKNPVSLVKYVFWLYGDMKELAGAKIAVLDTYSIPVSCLKHKKGLRVVQIWHALGAVKKFGWQSAGKEGGRSMDISKAMNMHKGYDCVISPSYATAKFYSQAFRVPMDVIHQGTLPHVDMILDGTSRKKEFLECNPEMADKEIILYLPTFRDGEADIVSKLYEAFDGDEKYALVISLHPLSRVERHEGSTAKGNFTSFDLMKIADIIITDYSACTFEASLLMKPLYFYIPDYVEYKKTRGLNIDMKSEMRECSFMNAEKLKDRIKNYDYNFDTLEEFQKKYVQNPKNSTKNLARLIVEG